MQRSWIKLKFRNARIDDDLWRFNLVIVEANKHVPTDIYSNTFNERYNTQAQEKALNTSMGLICDVFFVCNIYYVSVYKPTRTED